MQKLRELYMGVAKEGREMLIVKVTNKHYVGGDGIHIDFEELFRLFKQDVLEKSLISCYYL
jgi:hypothetical protein